MADGDSRETAIETPVRPSLQLATAKRHPQQPVVSLPLALHGLASVRISIPKPNMIREKRNISDTGGRSGAVSPMA